MKALAIVALVLAGISIFVPVMGVFTAMGASVLALISFRNEATLSGIAIGLNDGWLIVRWSLLLHNIGFTQVDPEKPINWSEFIIKRLDN